MKRGSSERPWTEDEIDQFFEDPGEVSRPFWKVAVGALLANIVVGLIFIAAAAFILLSLLAHFGVL